MAVRPTVVAGTWENETGKTDEVGRRRRGKCDVEDG